MRTPFLTTSPAVITALRLKSFAEASSFTNPTRRTKSETERAPDTIGVFAVDPENGTLAAIERSLTGGVMPCSFIIDATGSYLLTANQLSNNRVFKIDSVSGRLSKTGKEIKVDTPVP